MIEVPIIYKPHGNEDEADQIGFIEIINSKDNENGPEFGNYNIEVYGPFGKKNFRIENHERIKGFFVLLKKIVDEVVEEDGTYG